MSFNENVSISLSKMPFNATICPEVKENGIGVELMRSTSLKIAQTGSKSLAGVEIRSKSPTGVQSITLRLIKTLKVKVGYSLTSVGQTIMMASANFLLIVNESA